MKSVISFVRGHCATLADGKAIDYVSFCRREGDKSWPQVGRMDYHGQSLEDVESECARILDDIVQTAREEHRKEQKVRLTVYRGGSVASSRTFTLPGVDDGSHEDDPPADARGEVLGAMRELRTIIVDQNASLMRVASRGWDLASSQHAEMARLRDALAAAELRLAVMQAQKGMSPEAAAALQGVIANAPVLLGMLGELFKGEKAPD